MSTPADAHKASGARSSSILTLVKSVQFWWFVGHVLSMTGAFFYIVFQLRIFKAPRLPLFWYRESLIASVFTFGVIVYNVYNRKLPDLSAIYDENVQYLIVSLLWLFSAPFFLALVPFFGFSYLHVLSYTRNTLLPAFGIRPDSKIGAQINSLSLSSQTAVLMGASSAEFFTLLRVLFNFLTFRKGSVLPFIIYGIVFKLRYDSSPTTRQVVKNAEVRVDGLLSHPRVPVAIRQAWLAFKDSVRRYVGGFVIPGAPKTSAATKNQ